MEETRQGNGGEDKSQRKISGELENERLKIYNTGQPVDEQKTRKLETSSVEASDRRRQNRQEQRNGNQQEKVHWKESLNV